MCRTRKVKGGILGAIGTTRCSVSQEGRAFQRMGPDSAGFACRPQGFVRRELPPTASIGRVFNNAITSGNNCLQKAQA